MQSIHYFFFGLIIIIYSNSNAQTIIPIKLYSQTSTTQPSTGQGRNQTVYSSAGRAASVKFTYDGAVTPPYINVCEPYIQNIFQSLLNSNQQINVHIVTNFLGNTGVLANSMPYNVVNGNSFTSAIGQPTTQANTLYPVALAEKLKDSVLNNVAAPDILITFNSGVNWYLGTDANPASNEYDFATVIIHEILHGLGVYGTASSGSSSTVATKGSIPFIFERFIEDSTGKKFTTYADNGIDFSSFFFGGKGGAFFNGSESVSQNGGSKVKLYTKVTRKEAIMYHLDDDVYPSSNGINAANPNAILNPFVPNGKAGAKHYIGNVIRAILNDIGWKISYVTGSVDFYATLDPNNPSIVTNGISTYFGASIVNHYPNSTIINSSWKVEAYQSTGKVTIVSASLPNGNTTWSSSNFSLPSGYNYSRNMDGSVRALLTFTTTVLKSNNTTETDVKYANLGITAIPEAAQLSLSKAICSPSSLKVGFYAPGATSYQLDYGPANSFVFTNTINVAAGQSEYLVNGLAVNTDYRFRVRGNNNSSYGAYSSVNTYRIAGCGGSNKKEGEEAVSQSNGTAVSFFSNNLVIDFAEENKGLNSLSVFNNLGQKMVSKEVWVDDASKSFIAPLDLPVGIYIVNIFNKSNGSIVKYKFYND